MAKTVRVTAAEFADKHNRRTKAALDDMRRGIERVAEAPGIGAAKQQDKMRAKILASIDDGTWARRVSSVPLDEWKKDMLEKGVGRVAGGLDRAKGKVQEFAEKLITHQNSLLVKIDPMPSLTLEDSITRMTAWVRGMAEFKR